MTEEPNKGTEKTAADYLFQGNYSSNQRQRPFNGYPNYYYAGFWIRFFAFMVDVFCIKLLTGIVFALGTSLLGMNEQANVMFAGRVISLVIYLSYFILLTKLTNGQTIGKMLFGIQVVCFKEETLSWATVLVREGACRFILQVSWLLIGYLVAVFTPSKQHFGDLFSDTSVVTLNTVKASKRLAN